MEWIETFNNWFGFIGALFSGLVWFKMKLKEVRDLEEVQVSLVLEGSNKEVTLPLNILRKDVSRAEILGRLGMVPMKEKGKRFSIRNLFTSDFIKQVNKVARGESNKIVLKVTEEEFNQFDL